MWKVRELADKVTNVVMNYTEIEAKVREATNDDPWGPTGTLRHELAQATFSYDQFPEVMGMLWKRIAENKRSPRRIYKSLLLVHHLLLNGSDRVIRATTDRLYEIRQLQDYHVVYEPGFNISSIMPVDEYKDGEMNVRVKAKEVVELVQDEERLREDRKKSKKNRDKYVGIGSDRMASRFNDFDDDLHFKSQTSSSKYDDYEDQNELGFKSDSKSTNGTRFTSETSVSKTPVTIKLRSDVIQDENEFDPRAGEPTSASKGGDFADFQSAFGDGATITTPAGTTGVPSNTSTGSTAATANLDFFASTEPTAAPASGGIDLLGLEFSNLTVAAPAQPVIGSNISFDGFQQGFQSFQGFQNVQPLPQQSLPFQQIPSFQTSPLQQTLPQQQQNLLFGNNDVPMGSSNVGLLQPQQISNHINNNNVQQGNSGGKKPTLEGTTWSGLNFSMDDLNLSAAKPKPSAQPSMNQLLASPTKSKPF